MGDPVCAGYVIVSKTGLHCARGPMRCPKCKDFQEAGKKWQLIDIKCGNGMVARPIISLITETGEIERHEYDVLRVFGSTDDAMRYSTEHGVPVRESAF